MSNIYDRRYSTNRSNWKKTYGYIGVKPKYTQIVDVHTNISYSIDVNNIIRERGFFQTQQTEIGMISITKPTDISNCFMWFDSAQEYYTIISASTTRVHKWINLANPLIWLTQSTTTSCPTVGTFDSSINSIGFSGTTTGRWMVTNIAMPDVSTAGITLFFVMKPNSYNGSDGRYVISFSGSINNSCTAMVNTTGSGINAVLGGRYLGWHSYSQGGWGGSSTVYRTGQSMLFTQSEIISRSTINGYSGSITIISNSNTPGIISSSLMYMFRAPGVNTRYFSGDIYNIIGYSRVLTNDEFNLVDQYLKRYYGMNI